MLLSRILSPRAPALRHVRAFFSAPHDPIYDIVIVGGSIEGLTLAACLGK